MKCQNLSVWLILAAIVIVCSTKAEKIGRQAETWYKWYTDNYPNPQTDFTKCQQSKPSTICDPDSLLNTVEATELNDLIQRLKNTSPCLCKDGCTEDAHNKGLVVGVALMKAVYYAYDRDKNIVAKEFSQGLKKKWNLGACGNEILIVIIKDSTAANIEIGDAVKEFIPEETVEEIFEQCKDYLKQGLYYQGVETIINSLYDTIQSRMLKAAAGDNAGEGNTEANQTGVIVGIAVGVAGFIGLVAAGFFVLRRRKMRRDNNQNGFMYDGSSGRQGSGNNKREVVGPIVKTPVVFPDAVYQPCSIDDGKKVTGTEQQPGSDDDDDDIDTTEDRYLRQLEENPAYNSAENIKETRSLGVVDEVPEIEPTTPPVAVVDYINEANKHPSNKIGYS